MICLFILWKTTCNTHFVVCKWFQNCVARGINASEQQASVTASLKSSRVWRTTMPPLPRTGNRTERHNFMQMQQLSNRSSKNECFCAVCVHIRDLSLFISNCAFAKRCSVSLKFLQIIQKRVRARARIGKTMSSKVHLSHSLAQREMCQPNYSIWFRTVEKAKHTHAF